MAEIPLDYDRLGSRLRSIGDMALDYDRLGSRAKRVVVPGDEPELTEDDLFALFLVLYEEERASESSSSSAT